MSCNDDKTYEPCSCGCGGSSDCNCDCNECAPVNCIEQAINDALATKEDQLEGFVDRAEDAAEKSEAGAAASAASAAESKGYRNEAEVAATTATDAMGTVVGVANTLEDTANKLKQIADELGTAIAGISVVTWYYTAVSDNQKVIPVPAEKNQVDVQAIFIEGARQEPNRGFTYDALNKEITLAEGIPLGMEISIIIGTYSDNPNDFANTLASDIGASLIGTQSGQTVQQEFNTIDADLIKLKLNWAIESGYADSGFNFQSGGTLGSGDADKVVYDPVSRTWYSWAGSLPKVVPASTDPIADANWKPQTDPNLRDELAGDDGWSNIGTEFGKNLKEHLQALPSLSAVKYMTFAEYAALVAGNNSVNHQPKVQQVLDEAHNLKCSVYFPTGRYVFDTAVNVWTYVRAVWGDGSAIITRRYGSQFSSPGVIDPAHDTRKLFRMMGGALGPQSIHGLLIDGNARSFIVPKHTDSDQSLPNQTYYGDVEPVDVGPYIYGPSGQTPVAGTSYYNHDKKESGLTVFDMVFKDQPGGAVVGNGQNVRVFGNHFMGWYDHAVYIAGSSFASLGDGILCSDIVVTGNVFRNRINNRGNGAVKARFGVNRYAVTGNSFDIVDYCLAFEMGNGAATQPFGQVVVNGNTATCDGMFMQIGNDIGTEWFNTGWLKSLTITNNTVKSLDRIFLLGVSGGSANYIMDGYSVQVQGNVFFAPTFMSLYAFQTNTDWKINSNIINITGTAMIVGVDQAVVGNSSISIEDNILGVQRTDQVGYMAVSNFERVKVKNNELRNLYMQIGSYTTDLVIDENEVRYHSAIASKPFAQMYSGAGNGLNHASINRNKFKGKVGRCQLKFSSNSQLDAIENEFDGTSAPFIELHTSGYTPRVVRIDDNIMRGAGVLLAPLAAGVSLGSAASYMELMKNVMASANSGTQETVTLYQDTGAQSWVSHYQTIRCVKNTFRDALLGVNASGSAQSGLNTANKFWFGENATLNTTVTCNYPAANKANTDVIQTVNV